MSNPLLRTLSMMKLQITLSMLSLILSSTAYAATYYVDQTSGNDSNNGSSPSTPWRNSPGMAAFSGSGVLSHGDTVLFDNCDTWRTTGTQGIWLVGGVTYDGNVFGSCSPQYGATIQAASANDAGVVRFRDHATIATIFRNFVVDANHTVSTGIDINHRFYSLMNGATKRVQHVEVKNVASTASLGQFKYGIIISNHGGTTGYAENVEILDSSVHDISRDGLCLYPGDENANTRIRNILVRNNEVYNTGQDPTYGAGSGIIVKGFVVNAVVEYNYVHGTNAAGIFLNGNETNHFPGVGMSGIHIRYNLVNTPIQANQGNIRIYDTNVGDPKQVDIYGNIILANSVTGGLSNSSNKNSLTLKVYNNTFFNSFVSLTNTTDTASVEFRNNVIYYTNGVPFSARSGVVNSHSNNIYYRGSGTLVSIGGTAYDTGNLGSYEATGSGGNPLFKNITNLPTGLSGPVNTLSPNTDGLSLQESSVGVNNGIALPTPYNGTINSLIRPLGGNWDIGAYEFSIGNDLIPPSPPTSVRVS